MENNKQTNEPAVPAAAEKEPQTSDKTKSYKVKGARISHNGRVYKPGEKINLTEKEAARLKKYLEA
jgi:cell fate (sporulation/competence/biofilm development) regulator YmcA (YheA/YmcA/DUF963 family)